MLDADLLAAIQANPTAKEQAVAGNDVGCAATIAATLDPVVVPYYLNESGVLDVLGAVEGNAALAALESAAAAGADSGLLVRVVRNLQDAAGPGLNFGNAIVRTQLDDLATAGVLQADDVGVLKAAAEIPATIDHGQVSRVMEPYRPESICGEDF